jgi:hypothetical protein
MSFSIGGLFDPHKNSNLFILLPPVEDDETGGFFHPMKPAAFGPMPDPIDAPEEFNLTAYGDEVFGGHLQA